MTTRIVGPPSEDLPLNPRIYGLIISTYGGSPVKVCKQHIGGGDKLHHSLLIGHWPNEGTEIYRRIRAFYNAGLDKYPNIKRELLNELEFRKAFEEKKAEEKKETAAAFEDLPLNGTPPPKEDTPMATAGGPEAFFDEETGKNLPEPEPEPLNEGRAFGYEWTGRAVGELRESLKLDLNEFAAVFNLPYTITKGWERHRGAHPSYVDRLHQLAKHGLTTADYERIRDRMPTNQTANQDGQFLTIRIMVFYRWEAVDLARELNILPSRVVSWEAATGRPTAEQLQKLLIFYAAIPMNHTVMAPTPTRPKPPEGGEIPSYEVLRKKMQKGMTSIMTNHEIPLICGLRSGIIARHLIREILNLAHTHQEISQGKSPHA